MSIKLSDQVSVIKQINGSEISKVEYGLSAFNKMFEVTDVNGQKTQKPMGKTDETSKTDIVWGTVWPETTADYPFVWTRFTYITDSGDEYSYTCSGKKGSDGAPGKDGKDGSDGASGRGISQIDSYYVANSEKPEVSEEFNFNGWETDANKIELTSTSTKLWRCQVVTYTDTTKQIIGPIVIAVYVKDGEPAQCLYLTATDSCFKQVELKDNDTVSQKITPDEITITANITNYTGSNATYTWKKYIENESTSENLTTATGRSSSITVSKADAVSATYECTAKIGDVVIGTDRIYIPVVGESEMYWLLDNTFNVAADAEGKILEETKVVLQPVCYKNGVQQELSFYDSDIEDSNYYYWPQNDNITFSGISSGKEPKIIITIPKEQMLKELNGNYWFKAKCAGSGVWHTYRYTVTILKQSKGIKSVEYQYYATDAKTAELADKDQSGSASEISGLTYSYGINYPKLWQRYKTNYDDGTSSAWSKWSVIAYYGSDGANATLRRILPTSDIHKGVWQTENITFYFQKTSGKTLDNTWINDTNTSYYTYWFGDSSTAEKTNSSASSSLEIKADVFKANGGKDFTIEWYSDSTRKTLYDVETIDFVGTDIDISLSNDNIIIPADAKGNISTEYDWSNTTMTAQAYKNGVAVTPKTYTWTWSGCTIKIGSQTTVRSGSFYSGTASSLTLASMTADSAKITCYATVEGQKTEVVTGYVVKQKQGVQGEPGKDGEDGSDGAPGKDGKDGSDGAPGKDGTSAPNIIATPDHFWAGNTITLSVVYGDKVYKTAKEASSSELAEIAIDGLTYNGKQCYFRISNTDTDKYSLNSTKDKEIYLKLGANILGINNVVVELAYKETDTIYTQIDTKTLYPYTSDLHIDISDNNVVVSEGVTTASVTAVLKCQGQAVTPDGYEAKNGVVTTTGWTCEGADAINLIGGSAGGVKITGKVNKTYTVSATYNEEPVSAQFKILTIQEGKNAKYVVLSLDGTSPTHFTKETVTTNGEQVTKISPESITITATLINGAAEDKPSFQWQKKSASNDGWVNVEQLESPMTSKSSGLVSNLKVLNTQDGMYRCQATIDNATTEDAIYLPIIGQGEVYWLLDSAKTIAVDANNEVTNNVTFDLYPVCYKEGVKQDLDLSNGFSCKLALGSSSLTEKDYSLNKTDLTTTDKVSLTINKGFTFTNGQTINGTLTVTCGTNPHTYSFTITPVKQGEKGKDGADGENAKSYQIKTNQTYHSSSWQTADLTVDFQETNGSADWTNVVNGSSTGYVLAYFGAAGSYPTEAGKALLAGTVAGVTRSETETTVKTLTIEASQFQNKSMPLQIYWFSGSCSWVNNKFAPATGSILRDWETIEYVGMSPSLVVDQNCIVFQANSAGKTTIDSSNPPTITATAKKYNGTTNSTDDLYAIYTWSWKGTSATSPISEIKVNGSSKTPAFDSTSKTCSITTTEKASTCTFCFSKLDDSVDVFCSGKYYLASTDTDNLGAFSEPCRISLVKQSSYWRSQGWVDLSNAAYDINTWYPVVGNPMSTVDGLIRIAVNVALNSGTKPGWSNHSSGFSVNLDLQIQSSGWGTTSAKTLVYNDTYKWVQNTSYVNDNGETITVAAQSPASYQQLTNGSRPVLFLRGGGKYFVSATYVADWEIWKDGYTWTSTAGTQYTQKALPSKGSRPALIGESIQGKDGAKGEKGDTGATGENAVQYEIETNFTEMYVALFQDTKGNVTTKTFQYSTNGDTKSKIVTTAEFSESSYLGANIYKIDGNKRTKESSPFGGKVKWTTYYVTTSGESKPIASEDANFHSDYKYGHMVLGKAPSKQLVASSVASFTKEGNVICFPWYDTSVEAVLTDYNNYHDGDFYILVEYLDSSDASLAVPVKIPLKRATSQILAKFEITAYGFNNLTEDGTKGIKFEAAKGMTFYAGDAEEKRNIISIYKGKATNSGQAGIDPSDWTAWGAEQDGLSRSISTEKMTITNQLATANDSTAWYGYYKVINNPFYNGEKLSKVIVSYKANGDGIALIGTHYRDTSNDILAQDWTSNDSYSPLSQWQVDDTSAIYTWTKEFDTERNDIDNFSFMIGALTSTAGTAATVNYSDITVDLVTADGASERVFEVRTEQEEPVFSVNSNGDLSISGNFSPSTNNAFIPMNWSWVDFFMKDCSLDSNNLASSPAYSDPISELKNYPTYFQGKLAMVFPQGSGISIKTDSPSLWVKIPNENGYYYSGTISENSLIYLPICKESEPIDDLEALVSFLFSLNVAGTYLGIYGKIGLAENIFREETIAAKTAIVETLIPAKISRELINVDGEVIHINDKAVYFETLSEPDTDSTDNSCFIGGLKEFSPLDGAAKIYKIGKLPVVGISDPNNGYQTGSCYFYFSLSGLCNGADDSKPILFSYASASNYTDGMTIIPTCYPQALSFNPSTQTLSTKNISLSQGKMSITAKSSCAAIELTGTPWDTGTGTISITPSTSVLTSTSWTIESVMSLLAVKGLPFNNIGSATTSTSASWVQCLSTPENGAVQITDYWNGSPLFSKKITSSGVTLASGTGKTLCLNSSTGQLRLIGTGGGVQIQGTTNLTGAVTMDSTLTATGKIAANGGLSATTGTFSSTLTASGRATFTNSFKVTKQAEFWGTPASIGWKANANQSIIRLQNSTIKKETDAFWPCIIIPVYDSDNSQTGSWRIGIIGQPGGKDTPGLGFSYYNNSTSTENHWSLVPGTTGFFHSNA